MSDGARRPGRRLGRLARLSERPLRLRLFDAVALAAGGLLLLKLTALLGDTLLAPPGRAADFARVISHAHTGYVPRDPATTGSVSHKEEAPAAKPEKAAAPPVYQPAVPEAVSPTERAILEKLATRRDGLKARAEELDLREQMLNRAEQTLETGLTDLRDSEDKADLGGAKRIEAEKNALKGIVTMYETMKPKDAARVFDRLGLDVLVPIVLAMNPRKMAEVLALMGSEPAEKLTVALAIRARGGTDPAPAPRGEAGLPANELPALDPGPPTRPAMP